MTSSCSSHLEQRSPMDLDNVQRYITYFSFSWSHHFHEPQPQQFRFTKLGSNKPVSCIRSESIDSKLALLQVVAEWRRALFVVFRTMEFSRHLLGAHERKQSPCLRMDAPSPAALGWIRLASSKVVVSDFGVHRCHGPVGRRIQATEMGCDDFGLSVFGFNPSDERKSSDSGLCS